MVVSPDALKPPAFVLNKQAEGVALRCGFLAARYEHSGTVDGPALADLFMHIGSRPAAAIRELPELAAIIADLAAALGKE